MDELMSREMGQEQARTMSYFIQITVSDTGNGKEHARVVAESENDSLAPQSAFVIPAEQKQALIPAHCNGLAVVAASLNLGGSAPYEVKGTMQLLEGKKKQWLQLGFDP